MRLLLDTTVLIDVLRRRGNRPQLLAELVRAGHSLATTALNIAEVYAGVRPHEEAATELFLGALECHAITRGAARRAGTMKRDWSRKGRTLTLADTLVAAVAVENDCQVVTDNRRDFPMPEVKLYPLPE